MTFWTFNSGIPAANNDPSVDQPGMLNNNISTIGILGTDHVTFNSNGPVGPPNGGGGQHLQISFNGNNVPSVPPNLPTLFVNIQDGAGNNLPGSLPELFYYSGSAAHSNNQYVSTANGSVLLMGGIILKWGVATLPGTGFNQSVSFPVSFPNNCFSVTAISTAASNGVTVAACAAMNPGGFTAIKSSSSAVLPITYMAIGN